MVFLIKRGGVKMVAKKSSEVNKLEDSVKLGEVVNAKDPDKEVILAVMKILFGKQSGLWCLK